MLSEAEDAEELHKEQLGQLNTIMNVSLPVPAMLRPTTLPLSHPSLID
jgi:hypothetical protein